MGRCKQLLPLADRPVIAHCLLALEQAGVRQRIVVLGANGAQVAAAVAPLGAALVSNPDGGGDMSSSVRVGLSAVSPAASGVLICLADMPLVQPSTIRHLVERHGRDPQAILIPEYCGRRGHPLLFPLQTLATLRADQTLRGLRDLNRARVVPLAVDDPGIALDMDTPADFQRMQTLLARPG